MMMMGPPPPLGNPSAGVGRATLQQQRQQPTQETGGLQQQFLNQTTFFGGFSSNPTIGRSMIPDDGGNGLGGIHGDEQEEGLMNGSVQQQALMNSAMHQQAQHQQQLLAFQAQQFFQSSGQPSFMMPSGINFQPGIHPHQNAGPNLMGVPPFSQGNALAASAFLGDSSVLRDEKLPHFFGPGGSSQSFEPNAFHEEEDKVDDKLAGRKPMLLFMKCDEESLSEYQCLVRQQIEMFEAGPSEVESNAKGRNKPIVLGQVGIRCRHCSHIAPKQRTKGAMYYPAKLTGLYQAAQSLASGHLCTHCKHIPPGVRQELLVLKEKKSSAGGGKDYWGEGVRILGVYEDASGLRFSSTNKRRKLVDG